MSLHIYHATATLAELGLAMAIGTITKIFPPPLISDPLARETTQKRIASEDGKIAAFFYALGCWISNIFGKISRFVPTLVFFSEMLVLGGIGFCPDNSSAAFSLFGVALFGLFSMMLYVYVNRETFRKTEHPPAIEPLH